MLGRFTVKIAFQYQKPEDDAPTLRAGTLLGLTTKGGNLLLLVREDGQAQIKNFLAVRCFQVQTVLEEHEQVPGVLSPPAAQAERPADTAARIADLKAQIAWYREMARATEAGPA